MEESIEGEAQDSALKEARAQRPDGTELAEFATGVRLVLPSRGAWDPQTPLTFEIRVDADSSKWTIIIDARACQVETSSRLVLDPGSSSIVRVRPGDARWDIVVNAERDGRSVRLGRLRGPSVHFLSYLWGLKREGPFDDSVLQGDFSAEYNLSRNWINRRSRYAWFVQLSCSKAPASVFRRWLHSFFHHFAEEARDELHGENWAELLSCLSNYRSWADPQDFESAVRDVINTATSRPGAISGSELSDLFGLLQDTNLLSDRFRLATVMAAQTGSSAALAVVLDLLIELQVSDSVVAPRTFWEGQLNRPPMDVLYQLMWHKAGSEETRGFALDLCQLLQSHQDGAHRRFARALLPYLTGLQSYANGEWENAERQFSQSIDLFASHHGLRTKALINAFLSRSRRMAAEGDEEAAIEYLESNHEAFTRLKVDLPPVSPYWQTKLKREALWTRLRRYDLLTEGEQARLVLRELLAHESEIFGKPSERAQQWAKEIEIFDKLAKGDIDAAEDILVKVLARAQALNLPAQRTEMTVTAAIAAKYLLRGDVALFQKAMNRARDLNGFHFYDFSALWRVPLVCDIASVAISATDNMLTEADRLAVVGWQRRLESTQAISDLHAVLGYLLQISTQAPNLPASAEASRRSHVIEVAKACVQFCMDLRSVEANQSDPHGDRERLMTLPASLVARYDELEALAVNLAHFPQTVLTKRIMLLDALLNESLRLAEGAGWLTPSSPLAEGTLYDRLKWVQIVKWPEGSVIIQPKDVDMVVAFRNAEVHGRITPVSEDRLDRILSTVRDIERQVVAVFPIAATARGAGPLGSTLLMLDWARVPHLVHLSGKSIAAGMRVIIPKAALVAATKREDRVLPPGFPVFLAVEKQE